ncbi:MAG: UvrD-helicase domain-containing protein, partial [Oscillospiraceae bacterium]|nr:UvrD-helicase domain-containing protein [Oscillospiraceae bacterium]
PVPDSDTVQKLQDYVAGNISLTRQELKNILNSRGVKPWNILAVTFTNKAADELKQRLINMPVEGAEDVHASTFHSACVRILRTCIDRLGYGNQFTIYDTDDSLKLLKACLKEAKIDEKKFPPKQVLASISNAKDKMIAPENYESVFGSDYKQVVIAKLYKAYQEKLFASNALDFDDLIYQTVRVFETCPDVLEKYQNKFQYILVDEYQDTNHAQYRLISLLAEKYGNLCVVGDDDQSIYKFRGATIVNILNFEKQFSNCKTVKLEENYRSTQHILSSANDVISHNTARKDKKLWTSAGDGELVNLVKVRDEKEEALYIANIIKKEVSAGKKYSDFAVLYRMNALSNTIERGFLQNQIPYQIYGGIRFQDRKEIKDVTAYLSVLQNPFDFVRFERIINTPKRGIGEGTSSKIVQIAHDLHISPFEVIQNCSQYPLLGKRTSSLRQFAGLIQTLQQALATMPLADFFDFMLEKTGYLAMLQQETAETAGERIENIKEFRSNIVDYVRNTENPDLEGFLSEMALYTDADKTISGDTVSLMTMHSAKGLEFDTVFAAGMENNIFPGFRSMDNQEELEEERRLAYVTITRAKRNLYLLHAQERLIFGDYRRNALSRFINEINPEHLDSGVKPVKKSFASPAETPVKSGLKQQMAMISQTKKTPPSLGNPDLKLAVGDRIQDAKFGQGTVLRAEAMGNDYLLEIAFDDVGTKKLMARFRQITKL